MYHWGNYPGYWGNGGFSIIGIILSVLFWVLVIAAAVALVKAFIHHDDKQENQPERNSDKYLDIVMERYAKGEITKKEYLELKKDFTLKDL